MSSQTMSEPAHVPAMLGDIQEAILRHTTDAVVKATDDYIRHPSSTPEEAQGEIDQFKSQVTRSLSIAFSFGHPLAHTSDLFFIYTTAELEIKGILSKLIVVSLPHPQASNVYTISSLPRRFPNVQTLHTDLAKLQRHDRFPPIERLIKNSMLRLIGRPQHTYPELTFGECYDAVNVLPQYQERLDIDELAHCVMPSQAISLGKLRRVIEAAGWYCRRNSKHNLLALEVIKLVIRHEMMPRTLKMMALYKKLLAQCARLRKEELLKMGRDEPPTLDELSLRLQVARMVNIMRELGLEE